MANTSINPVEEKEKKPSALENAAKILGIVVQAGSLGAGAYDMFNKPKTPAPTTGVDFTMPKKKPLTLGLDTNFGGNQ